MSPALGFSVDYTGVELHGFLDADEDLRLGVLLAKDNYGGMDSDVAGFEAIFTPDRYRVEARAARFWENPENGWLYNASV